MRHVMKGGIWKNTEDEILKAAVMKYGLNQWARISSLLVRKSAKQCKARWYEWLDPAIKKTEWTREEDEKLLHLAKLMPTQWRTIAPIVGRTAAQCLDRYERLLDMAANKAGEGARYDRNDDPRRLRPGEIDPNPESKPARPDAVDMDEDEKEMLSEARARLANTRGKKAKRKARERQLEEARRLAALQKKRELKAAGIELRERQRRGRGIDYNKEVAFEKKPAPGFYDTNEEVEVTKQQQQEFRPVTLEELEGKRRKDIEAALIKADISREKMQERHDRPAALAKESSLNDPNMIRRRGKMMLPTPQVSEAELEAIARGGGSLEDLEDQGLADGAGGAATRGLLGTYEASARLPTDLRTPRAGGGGSVGGDRVLQQAQALSALQSAQTPLVGGANPELLPGDFSGITPRNAPNQTPNPLAGGATPSLGNGRGNGGLLHLPGATPGGRAIGGVAATPSGMATPSAMGATPMRTPIRDELGLNDPDSLAAAAAMADGGRRAERARQVLLRNELRAGLSQLPAPRMEYQVEVPELPEEEEADGPSMPEDAADRDARLRREAAAREAAELRKRSQPMQRGLPRPAALDLLPEPKEGAELVGAPPKEVAAQMVAAEVAALLRHEAAKYPLVPDGKKSRKKRPRQSDVPALDDIPLEELESASKLLKQEVDSVRSVMGHAELPLEEYDGARDACLRDIIYVPSLGRYARAAGVSMTDRVASVQAEFEAALKEMEKEAKRGAKLEEKVRTVTMGLTKREEALRKQGEELWTLLSDAQVERNCFQALQQQEAGAVPSRLEALRGAVQGLRQRERDLQERFKAAKERRDDLREAAVAAC